MPATNDLSLIGSYPITVKAEVTQFTDYTKTASTTLENAFDYTVYLNPCLINDFTTIPINKVTYTIGASAETSQTYSFT